MRSLSRITAARVARSLQASNSFGVVQRTKIYRRSYFIDTTHEISSFTATESQILSSALQQVPKHGFTEQALEIGAREAGYLDVTTNLFPRGAFDLIIYHLSTRRLALKEEVQFASDAHMGVGAKVRALALHRLRANGSVIGSWQQALAVMAQPAYIPASLHELSLLSDEIWFLAGDTAVDISWYTKRASLAAIYSSAEVFMTTDTSNNFKETESFLDRRLQELRNVGGSLGAIGEWVGVSGKSMVNVLRSKGVRI